LVIAASARPQLEGDVYRYRLEAARNFAWTVSHLYQVREAQAGDVTVTAYAFPFHPAAEEPALQTAVAALNTFSQLFSPYPRESLAVVEADFLDGMEYDGMFFLSHAFYDYYTGDEMSNLVIIAAHETAHQWWYGRVGNDQANEPWLDEALSTYSELLFYENVYPELVDWWWENRINFHHPQGWVDETIYQATGFYAYRNAVYLRGAQFLDELRQVMGDEVFFAFLNAYLDRFTYRQATADDFFALLAEHTGADLSAITARYFANR
jgi:aminopeptidase N